MTDLITRLRDLYRNNGTPYAACDAAADEIEAQCELLRLCRTKVAALQSANTKLVCSLDLVLAALNGSNVQDLHIIINTALAEYKAVQNPSDAEAFGRDLWSGIV